ncbi:hypothetical protein E2C01_047834 [Portunus trituberculatus]|uniref:Uncharacterized protein n=1 Tax=Portunus trituberculatus TaxID=210409 RepID=A0A5B7G239_PORTR|nr:hypothetical protein [Portunus trituberculatus]
MTRARNNPPSSKTSPLISPRHSKSMPARTVAAVAVLGWTVEVDEEMRFSSLIGVRILLSFVIYIVVLLRRLKPLSAGTHFYLDFCMSLQDVIRIMKDRWRSED